MPSTHMARTEGISHHATKIFSTVWLVGHYEFQSGIGDEAVDAVSPLIIKPNAENLNTVRMLVVGKVGLPPLSWSCSHQVSGGKPTFPTTSIPKVAIHTVSETRRAIIRESATGFFDQDQRALSRDTSAH